MSVVLSEHLSLLASAPDGIQKLRGLILELAVRGKLLPQDPNDEPAGELLKRIKQERLRLEADGTCKKSKPTSPVEDDEQPFSIPTSWKWVRVGSLGDTQTGTTPSKSQGHFFGTDYPFIKPGDIYAGGIAYDNEGLSAEGASASGRLAPPQSILMVCIGTIGKCGVIDRTCSFNQQINSVSPLADTSPFAFLVLRSPYFQAEAWERSSSTTIAILNKGNWETIPVPLPPLAEQHRIVAKVDELMALCDRLEAEQADAASAHARLVETLLGTLTQSNDAVDLATNWQRLAEHFDALFATEASIDVLKQTVLQLAVMGKLVPQNPDDEPASELLKWIAQERVRLEAEGICKQSKPLPPVSENEQPFVLPDGWEWVKVGSIAEIRGGKRLPAGHNYSPVPTEHIYIQVTNMKNGTILHDDLKYIDKATYAEIARYTISADDLYVTIAGTIGQVGCVPRSFDGMNLTENAAKLSFSHLDRLGLRMILSAPYVKSQFLDKANQQAQPKLALRNIADTVIALPPKDEQHRIVAKVDELMALCDLLKADLTTNRQHQATLADTLIESALEAA